MKLKKIMKKIQKHKDRKSVVMALFLYRILIFQNLLTFYIKYIYYHQSSSSVGRVAAVWSGFEFACNSILIRLRVTGSSPVWATNNPSLLWWIFLFLIFLFLINDKTLNWLIRIQWDNGCIFEILNLFNWFIFYYPISISYTY